MPNTGDLYTVVLRESHLHWGTHRYTDTRDKILSEIYIPIPRRYALMFGIYNSNYHNCDEYGVNLFNFNAYDDNGNVFNGVLKSQGNSHAGDIYAKNLSGYGNLKLLREWVHSAQIQESDLIEVCFISSDTLTLRKINSQ